MVGGEKTKSMSTKCYSSTVLGGNNTYTVYYVGLVVDHIVLVDHHSPRPAHLRRTLILHSCDHHGRLSYCSRRWLSEKLEPWMDPAEIDVIAAFLRPSTVMLEFGSGGSTLHWSKRVAKLYTGAEPGASVVRCMARRCSAADVVPSLRWESRDSNTWADDLSKGILEGFDPCLRRRVDWSKYREIQQDFES